MFKDNLRECWKMCRGGILFFTTISVGTIGLIGLICFFVWIGMHPALAFIVTIFACAVSAPFICAAWKTWGQDRFGHWFSL